MPAKKPATSAEMRRKKFVAHYLKHGNATKAAIHAGYSPRTAGAIGSQLLKHIEIAPKVTKTIDQYEVTAERIVRELALQAFSNALDYYDDAGNVKPLGQLTRDQGAAIEQLKIRRSETTHGKRKTTETATDFKLASKRAALELLGRHKRIFTEDGGEGVRFTLVIESPHNVPPPRGVKEGA